MAILNEVNEDNKPHKEVVVSVQAQSEAEESEVDEDFEENTEEGILDDYPIDTEDIDVIHMRVSSIPNFGLERFKQVKRVCFRQNFIIDIEGLEAVPQLEELDFYDNKISHMRGLTIW
ncbi:unnamed protein product [Mucor hiemalis]